MNFELETWLLDVGDTIIDKKAKSSYESLRPIEQAIYCMWVVDYAVRNSGTFGPIEDIHPASLVELAEFSTRNNLVHLSALIADSDDEEFFCESYYQRFDEACGDLKTLYDCG